MAELTSPSQSLLRPPSQLPLWSSPLVGPPLPMRSSSLMPPCLPLPSQPSLPSLPPLPPASKRNGSHGPIPSPATEHGWRSLTPFATGFRTYAPGPSSVGAKPFGFGPNYYARPPPPPPHPKFNMRMNAFVENKRKMEMVQGQTRAFPLPCRGTGVFHPLPRVQMKPSKNNNRGTREKGESSKPINIPGGNDGLVKKEECHQLSPSDEYGLPKEWTY